MEKACASTLHTRSYLLFDEGSLAGENQTDNNKTDLGDNHFFGFKIQLILLLLFVLICVWLVFSINSPSRHMHLLWNIDTLEHEDGPSLSLFSSSGANNTRPVHNRSEW